MNKPPSRVSAARRNAEALLSLAQKREQTFKLDQEREHEAMILKTARLRELRLAKEAEDEKLKTTARPPAARTVKPRRSKQT